VYNYHTSQVLGAWPGVEGKVDKCEDFDGWTDHDISICSLSSIVVILKTGSPELLSTSLKVCSPNFWQLTIDRIYTFVSAHRRIPSNLVEC
jgi:hypothetical protein